MAKVAKRRNRWILDYVDQSGRRKWETLPLGTTRKDADKRLSDRLQEIGAGRFKTRSEQSGE